MSITEITPELLHDLSGAARCRQAITPLAEQLNYLSAEGASLLARKLIVQGEDVALSRFLNVCVCNDLCLDAGLLGQSVAVVEDITDIPYCFKNHDGAAIAPLLAAGRSEEISWERQAMVVRIAAELAFRHHTAEDEVKQALLVLHQDVAGHSVEMLVLDSLHMLNTGTCDSGLFPMLTERDLFHLLLDRSTPGDSGSRLLLKFAPPSRPPGAAALTTWLFRPDVPEQSESGLELNNQITKNNQFQETAWFLHQ